MKRFRFLLFPFALLYGFITVCRNFLFDIGILKSNFFEIPIIAVGNLSVGGTGKTPQVEYLIRLLSNRYKVATLSRGYKRKTKGYLLANAMKTVNDLGDEPYQYFKKFQEIQVAVAERRVEGIQELLHQKDVPEVLLLDDAFQHRYVKAGFYILLTAFDDLFTQDFLLPVGTLRECRSGAKRADVIIVTKCPDTCDKNTMAEIRKKIAPKSDQEVFFSKVTYASILHSTSGIKPLSAFQNIKKLLVVGIANPSPFISFLKNDGDDVLIFSDHHHFSYADVERIEAKANGRPIVTTEKDYVRLSSLIHSDRLFYLPIESTFITDQSAFDAKILDYVGKNTRNS